MAIDGAYIALKGYCFQFDKTILEIFQNPTSSIAIEQIQDFGYDDYIVQVKHHDTDYSKAQRKAKKKKPILQLLDEFKKEKNKQYLLYIYFKGVSPSKTNLNLSGLNSILGSDASSFTTAIKSAFIKKFTIVYASDFQKQYDDLIALIEKTYSKSKEEAEFYYLIISSYLLSIITINPPSQKNKRKSSKIQLDDLISKSKNLIFKSAYSEFLGKDKYHKFLRKQYFNSTLNTSPFERFFLIESTAPSNVLTLKELILSIRTKWSKNRTKTIPDNERFAPYIYFNGILPSDLLKLKKELHREGHKIKDGVEFFGADFNIDSITEKATFHNQIFFRIITEQDHLSQILNKLIKTKEVYQFYTTKPIDITQDIKHIKVEIEDLNDIKYII